MQLWVAAAEAGNAAARQSLEASGPVSKIAAGLERARQEARAERAARVRGDVDAVTAVGYTPGGQPRASAEHLDARSLIERFEGEGVTSTSRRCRRWEAM